MVELELVGLSEDGSQLVFADAEGCEFTAPLDDRLRALVRRDRVRTGREKSMESALRPRDIQARIRAGQDPEAVAELAQVPVDRIMGYAVPVIAERQHIAERAQRSAIRRKNAEGPGQMLGDAVAERLRSRNVDPETCDWDAWRREDGRWTVSARFRGDGGERTGLFVFDALSRYTLAADDDARWLVGEAGAEREQPRRRTTGRRLSAVSTEYDASLFDVEDTTDLTAVADVLRGETLDEKSAAGPSKSSAGETGAGTGTRRPDEAGETGADRGDDDTDEHAPDDEAEDDEAEEPAARAANDRSRAAKRPQQPKPEKRGRRGRGRASVPSWDEIMFGQPKE